MPPLPIKDTPDLRMSLVYHGFPPNHCCSRQVLRRLPSGEWLAVFVTGGAGDPDVANHLVASRSADEGRTWTPRATVHDIEERAVILSEVVVMPGEVRVFESTHRGNFDDWFCFELISRDGGHTWPQLVPFTPMPRRSFVRNLYVSSWGEWLLPYQTYNTAPDPAASPLRDGSFQRALNGTLHSLDSGRSWERSNDIGPTPGWAENNVVELENGHLAMLIRADGQGCLLRSDSVDLGRTWSPPCRCDIPNAGSKFRLFRLHDGRILLLHNPIPGMRFPLSLWMSHDYLKTWACKRVLVDFPGALNDPDGFVDEETGWIHFAFDYNRHDVIYVGAKLPD